MIQVEQVFKRSCCLPEGSTVACDPLFCTSAVAAPQQLLFTSVAQVEHGTHGSQAGGTPMLLLAKSS